MQEIALSAGVSPTEIKFFSFGQAIKSITAGGFKSAAQFLRSKLDRSSIRYFEEKAPLMRRMAAKGLILVLGKLNGRVYITVSL